MRLTALSARASGGGGALCVCADCCSPAASSVPSAAGESASWRCWRKLADAAPAPAPLCSLEPSIHSVSATPISHAAGTVDDAPPHTRLNPLLDPKTSTPRPWQPAPGGAAAPSPERSERAPRAAVRRRAARARPVRRARASRRSSSTRAPRALPPPGPGAARPAPPGARDVPSRGSAPLPARNVRESRAPEPTAPRAAAGRGDTKGSPLAHGGMP